MTASQSLTFLQIIHPLKKHRFYLIIFFIALITLFIQLAISDEAISSFDIILFLTICYCIGFHCIKLLQSKILWSIHIVEENLHINKHGFRIKSNTALPIEDISDIKYSKGKRNGEFSNVLKELNIAQTIEHQDAMYKINEHYGYSSLVLLDVFGGEFRFFEGISIIDARLFIEKIKAIIQLK